MANTLDPMDLKQIITLHLEGVSNRKAAEMLGISRNTINGYLSFFKACDYSLEELLKKETPQLNELFPSHTTIVNERFDRLMTYLEKVHKMRDHPGFTFMYHYNEYKQQVDNPYGYTQFMEHYRRKHGKIKGSMKLDHIAGHEMYVDYAGKKLQIQDTETGKTIDVEVFVAILPSSQYTYVEACLSQKREDLFSCMANALSYYGGVPKGIVSDNLKSAVTRASKYEPIINKTFKEFALHYKCAINPTRSYSPQDKALVENAVNLVYQRIYYPIREMTFFCLADLNAEIHKRLEAYNDLLFSRKQASRRELFQTVERELLKPLPTSPYEMKDYRRAKVQKIGYVYFSPDKTYYSVPYRYIGKSTQIQYTKTVVEVHYNHVRIAMHMRKEVKGSYITIKDHLSSQHNAYSEWSVDYFKNMASKHGEYVLACISGVLSFGDYPETQYKRSMGIIQLHKQYGSSRLNTACMIAVEAGTYSYKRICNILKNNMDASPSNGQEQQGAHIPKHNNIRGSQSYQ